MSAKNHRLYFMEGDDECCYSKQTILRIMKEEGIKTLTVYEAKAEFRTGYFYCKHFDEMGESNGTCGRLCEAYQPNNGRNGRCKHYGYPYSQTEKQITLTL